MTPLNQAQTPFIDNALAGMRTAYNRFDVLPCEFTGQPEDRAALDVIPYELPMAEEFAAGSVAYSLAWATCWQRRLAFAGSRRPTAAIRDCLPCS